MNETPTQRIAAMDIARFYGMLLVYYGHIIERVMYLENPVAAAHYKWIYSFHMPFFFLLSGLVANPNRLDLPFGRWFKRTAASRLIPYFLFSLFLALASLVFSGHFVAVDLSTSQGYIEGTISTLLGFPVFNIPLWFMAALVSVEFLHRLIGRYLTTDAKLLIAAVIFYLGGYYLNLKIEFLMKGWNFWIINEAPVMLAFYWFGVFLRRRGAFTDSIPPLSAALGAVVCLGIVGFTYDLNTGPFRLFDAVVVVMGGHGNIFLFPFTALAGSLMLIFLGRLSGKDNAFSRFLAWMGKNVIILFCLNGVFYHFLNGPGAAWFAENFSGDALSVTIYGLAATAVSMALCLPVVYLFSRFLPRLVGRPYEEGPILGRFAQK